MGVRVHALGGLIAAIGASGAAEAAIIFTYEAPQVIAREFGYQAPGGSLDAGSLAFATDVVLGFTIDATQEGGPRFTVPATLHFADPIENNFVGPVEGGNGFYRATASLNFEFRIATPRGGLASNVLLAGQFFDGRLTTFLGSGSVVTAQNDAGGTLRLEAGPALFAALLDQDFVLDPGGFAVEGPASAAWSLADFSRTIGDSDLVEVPRGSDGKGPEKGSDFYLPDFQARSSFVASATVVPAPGMISVSLLSGALLLRRRR